MTINTARALRDLLSIIIAACKDKKLTDIVRIKVDRTADDYQYIIIKFIGEVK